VGGPGTLAIGVSASGATLETVDALSRHREAGSRTVAITNAAGSPLEGVADIHLPMHAGDEVGGVACRSFQHTLGLLLALEDPDLSVATIRSAADATDDLLTRREAWLARAVELAAGSSATFLLAPDARISSAEQGALMLREGPRRPADACEAGDWLHVDVYLTKALDYRAVLFAGSGYDDPVMDWMRQRGARVLAVGADVADAAQRVRYRGDDDPNAALLTEVLVPELIAATLWVSRA
jgi:glutamine---fructose-6-phosphate transaminase (isomerizing)